MGQESKPSVGSGLSGEGVTAEHSSHAAQEAVDWLRARRYVTVGSTDAFRLTADEFRCDDFVLRRGRFTSIDVIRHPRRAEGHVTCTVFLSGSGVVSLSDSLAEIGSGTLVLHDDADIVSFASSTPVVVVQLETEWSRLGVPSLAESMAGVPLVAGREHLEVFVALADAVLGARPAPAAASIPGIRAGLEACLAAAVATSSVVPSRSASVEAGHSAGWSLYRRAAEEMIERFRDPGFDVGVLTERLEVTERRLSQAFGARNTSPAKYLRQLRALTAFELLNAGEIGGERGTDDGPTDESRRN